jgi:hypothetical protein
MMPSNQQDSIEYPINGNSLQKPNHPAGLPKLKKKYGYGKSLMNEMLL